MTNYSRRIPSIQLPLPHTISNRIPDQCVKDIHGIGAPFVVEIVTLTRAFRIKHQPPRRHRGAHCRVHRGCLCRRSLLLLLRPSSPQEGAQEPCFAESQRPLAGYGSPQPGSLGPTQRVSYAARPHDEPGIVCIRPISLRLWRSWNWCWICGQ